MSVSFSVQILSKKHYSLDELSKQWQLLEQASNNHFFLSWQWIGQWLKALPFEYFIVQASVGDEVVGLGIVVENTRKSLLLFPIKQWWLHRTGDQQYDQCWPEYNDFLIRSHHRVEIRAAMVAAIKANCQWHEFIIGMAEPQVLTDFSQLTSHSYLLLEDSGNLIDFSQVSSSYNNEVLSRNTRQKINQTEKLLTKEGAINFAVYDDLARKTKVLSAIKTMHVSRWQNTLTPSGFMNDVFDHMLTSIIESPSTEIAVLTVNDVELGYLVNFVYQNKVYFYLSALQKHDNNKIKIGMLLHRKTIEYYYGKELSKYDFLVGENQYKKSLSNEEYSQRMLCYYRASKILKIERFLKKIKQKVTSIIKSI